MDFHKDQLLEIMREAGRVMLSAHGVEGDVSVKAGSANFVTVYDVRIQNFIIDEIRRVIPGAVFIAEEKDNDPDVLKEEFCFIIDPIDGTTNFIRDYRHSCISLAMVSRGETVFGAVYDPYLDEMFSAEKGKGAFLNGKSIYVSEREPDMAIVAYGTSPYYKDSLAGKTFAICRDLFMNSADVRRCGSAALDLAYTAAGRNDAFFECMLSPWDIAAGALLITEAGGIISDMNGDPVTLTKPVPVIASNEKCREWLCVTVKKHN